jgi:iron uptake system EfeUOB component EfeO/EfeM
MEKLKRLNANVPCELYSQVKSILKDENKTITDFIIEGMNKLMQEYRLKHMIDLYDRLADAPCTEEAMKWEDECITDGLR